jgi:hypothetical protein
MTTFRCRFGTLRFQLLDIDGPVPTSKTQKSQLAAARGNSADGNYDDSVYGKLATPTVISAHHLAKMASQWGPESWQAY